MKVLTYFSFTLSSIFIQFSVMDFIQDKLLLNEDKGIDLNLTHPKTQISHTLKDLSLKPLYNNSQQNNDMDKNSINKKIYRNTSLPDMQQPSTDAISTILDIFLYENSSITEIVITTDSEYTSSGFDNATEVTYFVKNNDKNKSDTSPSIKYNLDCNCNLLYEVCDINCCCDSDCDNSYKKIFNCMESQNQPKDQINDLCISHILHGGKRYGNILDMFCIVKMNLPEKRNIIKNNHDYVVDNQYFKWQSSEKPKSIKEFSKTLYKIGDPMWLLKNTSIYHIDLPTSTVNNYCTGRKSIKFLKNEVINCNVKFEDLEMLHLLKTVEGSSIISSKDITANSTVLNCSSLHCTNWTIIVCDGLYCESYNKKKHEPSCNNHTCTNIALTIDYTLYYYDSRIANVTVTFYIRNITTALKFMAQIINVKFVLGNKIVDQIIEFSGSPGYKKGLVIVVSSRQGNYTDFFYQSNVAKEKYFSFPVNENGQCVLTNSKLNFIQFGINKRIKCRYFHNYNSSYNNIDVCKYIQGNISELFSLNNKRVISPYGNPFNVKDSDWIHLHLDSLESVYGKIDNNLNCYNVISKILLTFTFENVNNEDNNRLLSLKVGISTRNISFTTTKDISTIVTTDIHFVNVSKPTIFEYARSPRLNVYIPNDFFFPYPSNNSYRDNEFMFNMYYIVLCVVYYLQIK